MNTPHLTEDQIADLVTGTRPVDGDPVTLHLAGCADCRRELADLRASLEAFSTESLTRFEQQARSVQPRAVHAAATSWRLQPSWLAAAAALVLAVLLGTHSHTTSGAAPAPTVAGAGHTHNPAQLAADNQLLTSIDAELSWDPKTGTTSTNASE